MAWSILRRLSPLKRLRDYISGGGNPREVQRRSDVYKLFLYTQLRERMAAEGVRAGAGSGARLNAIAEEVVEQVCVCGRAGLECSCSCLCLNVYVCTRVYVYGGVWLAPASKWRRPGGFRMLSSGTA